MKLFRYTLLLVLLFSKCANSIYAQADRSASLFGKITIYGSDEVLIGSMIELNRIISNKVESYQSRTDVWGDYLLENIHEGIYQLKISYLGFSDHIDTLLILSGDRLKYNYCLKSKSFAGEYDALNAISNSDLHLYCTIHSLTRDVSLNQQEYEKILYSINQLAKQYGITFFYGGGCGLGMDVGHQQIMLVYLNDILPIGWYSELSDSITKMCKENYNVTFRILEPRKPFKQK